MAENCCAKGILYGLLPHSFCVGFILFSVIGAAGAATVFKKFMLVPYFFQILVAISFAMATLSAIFYLKKAGCLCKSGIKNKWKYLTILYGITIFTNLFMFSYVLPALANITAKNTDMGQQQLASLSLTAQIPCTGHAPLIMDELKKDNGIKNVVFSSPDVFYIKYNPSQTSPDKIAAIDIFKTYKLKVINN